jgi:hypothetical protein
LEGKIVEGNWGMGKFWVYFGEKNAREIWEKIKKGIGKFVKKNKGFFGGK